MPSKKKVKVKAAVGTVKVTISGQQAGTVESGVTLRAAVSKLQREHNLRSVTVLLNDRKVKKSSDAGRKLASGDRIELIAKDTRG